VKQQVLLGFIVFFLLLLLPLFGLGKHWKDGFRQSRQSAPQTQAGAKPAKPPQQPSGESAAGDKPTAGAGDKPTAGAGDKPTAGAGDKPTAGAGVAVMRSASGQVETIALQEYLVGVVAAELPASCHNEALKAQAVASYTYARYRREIAGKQTLSDSGASDQGYLSAQQRRERWGSNFALYEAKVQQAVSDVRGESIAFQGKPIFAAYHSLSPGKTESAKNYWGVDYAYLQAAESPGDRLAPDYQQTVRLTKGDVKDALKKAGREHKDYDIALGKDPAKWFGEPRRSDSGTVLELTAGGQKLSGRELREFLGLRSADFSIAYKGDEFVITTRGYGHGVGMSQYGADFMARQGSSYKERLEHYYLHCQLTTNTEP
jgi:stage II sporulation protein D